jgi:hypothetical protein
MIASVMAALAEFERDLIREHIKSGIATGSLAVSGSDANQDSVHRTTRRQRCQVGGGWSELPVNRSPRRAQQKTRSGQSCDARMRRTNESK